MEQSGGDPSFQALLAAGSDGASPSVANGASGRVQGPAQPVASIQVIDEPTKQPRKRKKKAAAGGGKRRGWGPFRSVLKERSVEFNLTLDVQQLQQEIQDMQTLRALLQTKTLAQRHSADGSLLKTALEFYRLFRSGFDVSDGRRRAISEREQVAYLYSAMDEHVDVGNGLYGPEVMAQQLAMYSTFIQFLSLSLESFDLIAVDESVVVSTTGTFRFQVLRDTIQQIFPHVMSSEALVAKLVGQKIDVLAKLTFYFNANGKCARYEVDIDFLAAFAMVVTDPLDLDLLFNRALIADNCMFGVLDRPEAGSGRAATPEGPPTSLRRGQEPHIVPFVASNDYAIDQRGYECCSVGSGDNMGDGATAAAAAGYGDPEMEMGLRNVDGWWD